MSKQKHTNQIKILGKMSKKEILDNLVSLKEKVSCAIKGNNYSELQEITESFDKIILGISSSKFQAGIDLTGMRFGSLTVLGISRTTPYSSHCGYTYVWNCRCDCGAIVERTTHTLVNPRLVGTKHMCPRCASKTHGESKTRLYEIWIRIKEICYNPNFISYKRYGGKGIQVCPEWRDNYTNFAEWAMSVGYREHMVLYRLDAEKDFSPSNCYLKTLNSYCTIDGQTKRIGEWCKQFNVNYATVMCRRKRGLPQSEWFTPVQRKQTK